MTQDIFANPLQGKTIAAEWHGKSHKTADDEKADLAAALLGLKSVPAGTPADVVFVPKGQKGPINGLSLKDLKSKAEDFAKQAFGAISQLNRQAYAPRLEPGESGDPQDSRYFGCPWVPNGFAWPEHSGQPLDFVVQINLATAPAIEGLPTSGILSMFYGENRRSEKNAKVFLFDANTPGSVVQSPQKIQAYRVAEWVPFLDSVQHEELEEMVTNDTNREQFEILLEYHTSRDMNTVTDASGKTLTETEALRTRADLRYGCFMCDKLGGHPYWVQAPERPEDTNGTPMVMVMQVGLDEPWPLNANQVPTEHPLWGIGQIFWSKDTGEVKHVWACT